jgi:hypothetical protein
MLDQYDPNMLDEREVAPLDYEQRERAEERMRQRDAREGRGPAGNRALGAAFAQDSGGELAGRGAAHSLTRTRTRDRACARHSSTCAPPRTRPFALRA